mmetsp:Transcript_5895/g.8391  ORF Transcript_5895/g.8391 Transcript_5895/m.8391 type:complete len:94 (-) Transcript_5895:82-363(-)
MFTTDSSFCKEITSTGSRTTIEISTKNDIRQLAIGTSMFFPHLVHLLQQHRKLQQAKMFGKRVEEEMRVGYDQHPSSFYVPRSADLEDCGHLR